MYCGALVHADDFALIADSLAAELQALLDITSNYAFQWRYSFNVSKSFVWSLVSPLILVSI